MAFDGSHELHYVGGVLQETDKCAGKPLSYKIDAPLRIGARGEVSFCKGSDGKANSKDFTHCSQFQGDVDEVMLFSRALTAAEVEGLQKTSYRTGGGMANVYASGTPDVRLLPKGAVGFWPLDGDGQDLAGGNHAQVVKKAGAFGDEILLDTIDYARGGSRAFWGDLRYDLALRSLHTG